MKIHFGPDKPLDSKEVLAVRRSVERVIRRYDRAYLRRCVTEDRPPLELLRALAESGLLGIGLSERLGGSGGGLAEEVAAARRLKELLADLDLEGKVAPSTRVPGPACCAC